MIALRRLETEIETWATIYRDATGRDQLVAATSRADTGRGKKAVEPHFYGSPRLNVGLRFWEADDFRAVLPLAAFLEQFDAFEALQNVPFRGDCARAFQTTMLGHTKKNWPASYAQIVISQGNADHN